MKKSITCYSPNIVNNPYAANIRRLLNERGYSTLALKEVLKDPKLFYECNIFNFNWYENVNNWKQYFAKLCLLKILHIAGKRIIYTLHNKKPHDSEGNQWSLKMMKEMCKNADKIVGLCPDTREVVESIMSGASSKLEIIPHPNYILNYNNIPSISLRNKYSFSENDMVFLFMGAISPYKNLEMLIDIFKKVQMANVKLLIAGSPSNEDYRKKLDTQIGNTKNIITDFRYIPDDEIPNFYKTCNIVILPYRKESSLNSGAVYLSFSLKRTVICPDIGTMNALPDKSIAYCYHYDTDDQHERLLSEVVSKVCDEYRQDKKLIEEKGKRAYHYVQTQHGDKVVGTLYDSLYKRILRNDANRN